jgi:hypothetical protein
MDHIAVRDGILRPAKREHADAARENRSRAARVEGAAATVRRQDLAFTVEIAVAMGDLDGDAARQHHVALAGEQALDREMDCDEGGRAGGLDRDARPREIQLVGERRREEIAIVAGMAEQECASRFEHVLVRQQVVHEIRVHAAAGEDADRAVEASGRVACVLESGPGRLVEMTVLGVEDRRILRTEAEEARIEEGHVVEVAATFHVFRIGEQSGIDPGLEQLFVRVTGDAFDAVSKVGPQRIDVGRAREATRSTDDRDIGLRHRLTLSRHQPLPGRRSLAGEPAPLRFPIRESERAKRRQGSSRPESPSSRIGRPGAPVKSGSAPWNATRPDLPVDSASPSLLRNRDP